MNLESILAGKSITIGPCDSFIKIKDITPIYHIHGIINDPENIVLTNEDYVSLFRPSDYRQARLPFLIKKSTVLMLGYSLNDINVISSVDLANNVYKNINNYHESNIIQVVWEQNPKRCEDNSTTSLCDEDAFERFRSCVIDLSERKVTACCMGSDGVEDAYRDTYTDFGGKHTLMGGVNTFYKQLLCSIAEHSPEDFMQYLDEMLPEFSRTGSGDDISVAGIVDTEAVRALVNSYKSDIEIYDIEEKLFQKQNDLNSKKRKHGILEKRMNDKAAELVALQGRKKSAVEKVQRLEAEQISLEEELKTADSEKQKYISDTDIILDNLNSDVAEEQPFGFLSMFKKHCANHAQATRLDIINKRQTNENKCLNIRGMIESVDQQRKQISLELNELGKQIELSKAELAQAKNDFETYDDQFRAIENDIAEIKAFISSLSATTAENNKSDK